MIGRLLVGLVFTVFTFSGCATYETRVKQGRDLLRQGQFSEAAEALRPLAEKEGGDQLVYLLDYALAQQLAGDLEGSNRSLLQAERLAQIQDYYSLSRISGSLLLSEEMVQYKGEDYEKILIHIFLATNFLLLNDLEAAQVETRKINQKLHLYRTEAKRNYRDYPFAYYISGLIWEKAGNFDSAYIDYRRAYELAPHFLFLREDIYRVAYLGRKREELTAWRKRYPGLEARPQWRDPHYGEVVFLYQQGWGPRKRPHPEEYRLPQLRPIQSQTQRASIKFTPLQDLLGSAGSAGAVQTERILDVNQVATEALEEVYGLLLAKRLAGIGVKAVVADQVRQKNEALGMLAWIGMNLMDRADLRHWSTLPESLQIARVFLPVGEYRVDIQGFNALGLPIGEAKSEQIIRVEPRQKQFVHWRSLK